MTEKASNRHFSFQSIHFHDFSRLFTAFHRLQRHFSTLQSPTLATTLWRAFPKSDSEVTAMTVTAILARNGCAKPSVPGADTD